VHTTHLSIAFPSTKRPRMTSGRFNGRLAPRETILTARPRHVVADRVKGAAT
jgi:hypothetical protein